MISTLRLVLKWLILLPVLLAVVLLAVANDQIVTVHLNPFDTDDPVLRARLALYQLGFLLFVVGVLVGALVAWNGQRKVRRRTRDQREEASPWQVRAEQTRRRAADERPASRATAFLPRPERG